MARTDPTIYMRIPQELKDALDAAAAENKRSLTAEVVARLEASFHVHGSSAALMHPNVSHHASASAVTVELDQLFAALENKALMLSMRYDMVKLRNENLTNQIHRISAESQLLAKNAKTDADFKRSEEKIAELDAIEEQAELLRLEAEQIVRDRNAAIAELNAVRDALTGRRKKLEQHIAQRTTQASSLKNPSDH